MYRCLIGSCVLLALTGCAGKSDDDLHVHMRYDLGGVSAHEFLLIDGTRCVVTNRGGVACDWQDRLHDLISRGAL